MIVSFVFPVFNCAGNIKPLFNELSEVAAQYPMIQPEYIFVDDASTDASLSEIESLNSPFIKIVGLKTNVGSYKAALRGLEHVTGARAVVMAADGQDNPEVAYNLIRLCDNHGMSAAYRSDSTNGLFGSLFHKMMTLLIKPSGSGRVFDIVVIPSEKIEEIKADRRCQTHLFYGLDAMFKSKMMFEHSKRPRQFGPSGWTVSKKIRLVVESVAVFLVHKIR